MLAPAHLGMAEQSLPSRGAWIEINCLSLMASRHVSLPSRGAWIEILDKPKVSLSLKVAPLAGSVDRNSVGLWVVVSPLCRSPRGERG